MKRGLFLSGLLLGIVSLWETGCVVPGPPGPPPLPVVEWYGPAPYPDAVWVGGDWRWHEDHRRYEWHHGDWHHRGEWHHG